MMRVASKNPPVFDHPHKAAVLTALNGMAAGKRAMTFDEIRAALKVDADALPDGALHQIALDAGFTVEVDG